LLQRSGSGLTGLVIADPYGYMVEPVQACRPGQLQHELGLVPFGAAALALQRDLWCLVGVEPPLLDHGALPRKASEVLAGTRAAGRFRLAYWSR